MPTTQTVWEQPNWTIHYIGNYNQGVAEMSVFVYIMLLSLLQTPI